jgi:hypothetical protein
MIVRAGPMLNAMEFNRYQLAVTDAAEGRAAVRALHKVGVDFTKLHRRTSRETYFGIAQEARTLKIPFTGHVPMTITPCRSIRRGTGDHRAHGDALRRDIRCRARGKGSGC